MNQPFSSRRFVSAAIALAFAISSVTLGISPQQKGVSDDRDALNSKIQRTSQIDSTKSFKSPRLTVTDIGPELGISYAIEGFVINPLDRQQIIVPSQNGIFKSIDGGYNWRRLRLAPNDNMLEFVVSVRHDPRDPLSVYAITNNPGVFGWGLFHSTDFGETWQILLGIPDHLVDSAPHPTSPSIVFGLQRTADAFMPGVERGSALVKSVDGVGFFYVIDNGLPEVLFDSETGEKIANPIFTSMAISPVDPNVMYVASPFDTLGYYPGGVYKSEDGGQTFVLLENSPSEPLQIFPHPTDRNTFFVQAQGDSVTGMFYSNDGGNNFEEVMNGLPADKFNFFLEFGPNNPAVVYVAGEGGLFRSQDGGLSFSPTGLRETQVGVGASTLSVDPTNSNIIYVNTSLGNFKSVNGGDSFQPINRGWRATNVSHITFDNATEPNLYIATTLGNGLFMRPGGRKNFETLLPPVPQTVYSSSWISSLSVAPTNPKVMIALSRTQGVFRSTDGGHSWNHSQVDTNQSRFTPLSSEVVFDPTNAANVYIACGNAPSPGFYRSNDGGVTFTRSFVLGSPAESAFSDLALNPLAPDTIYTGSLAFLSDSPLLKSLDGGLNFTPTTIFTAATIREIVVDPRNPQTIYVSGAFETESLGFRNILRSDDGGVTFSAADEELNANLVAIAIDPIHTQRLFAWTWEGLFLSENRGASWMLLDNEETMRRAAVFGTSMTVNPRNPNLIYLAGASVLEVELKQ